VAGDQLSSKPSGLSGSGGFGLDAVRLQQSADCRLETRSCSRDAAQENGDRYYAKHFYLQAGKFAVWRDDWAGLLAAACGIKTLERERGPYSSTNALLLRAMVVAEKRQSQSGLVAVAKAFAALGEDKVGSMVLSLVGKDWVEETDDSADIVSPGCWDK
jgi:hypothetical protein